MQIAYKYGLSNNPLKPFDRNEKNADRVEDLLNVGGGSLIIKVCKHYIQNFIPTPIENEDEYWMCSTFPGNDYDTPVRINIYWHEVLKISQDYNYDEDKWEIMIFTNREFLSPKTMDELKNKIEGLQFDEDYKYEKGLSSQLAAILPLESYFTFVSDERVFESVRQYNNELSNKGRKVHKGHNYELARVLLQA